MRGSRVRVPFPALRKACKSLNLQAFLILRFDGIVVSNRFKVIGIGKIGVKLGSKISIK